MSQHEIRLIEVGDVSFRVVDRGESCWVGGERFGFWDVFEQNRYDQRVMGLLDRFVGAGGAFVDAGAWVGAFSLYAAAKGGSVVAIEPDPAAFAVLAENAALNDDLDLDLHLFPFALAGREGVYLMNAQPSGQGVSRLSDGGELLVKAGTLQRILATAGVDPAAVGLVKVDVEGYEMELLPTLAPWLASQKVPLIASFHGLLPDQACFNGFPTVSWPADAFGDVVCLPFVSLGVSSLTA